MQVLQPIQVPRTGTFHVYYIILSIYRYTLNDLISTGLIESNITNYNIKTGASVMRGRRVVFGTQQQYINIYIVTVILVDGPSCERRVSVCVVILLLQLVAVASTSRSHSHTAPTTFSRPGCDDNNIIIKIKISPSNDKVI